MRLKGWAVPLGVGLLLAVGFGLQARFFARYPQPSLFGDSAGYFWAGEQVRKAGQDLVGSGPGAAGARVRPILHFLGVGALFSLLPGDRGDDVARFRLVLAGLTTLGMLGAFLLARSLSGRLGGFVALAIAVIHPSFAMLVGRLYPEPVSAAVLVWAVFFYVRGVQRGSARLLAASGATLIAGLLFRPKLIPYMLVFLALASFGVGLRLARSRRLVLAFALGWLTLGGLWVAAALAVAGPVDAKLPEYNLAWKQYYPYGFWQFLDCDGWEGPFRLKAEPYYKALEAAAREDPDLLRSRPRQYAFTLRYVASRPVDSTLTVLDSLWRLYSRPENPYRWDYPFDYELQHLLQALVALFALAACVALVPEWPAAAGVFLVPACLWLLHGLAFSLPRYGAPPLLILIAAAGAFVGWALPRLAASPRSLAPLAAAALAVGLLLATAGAILMAAPEAARWLRLGGQALLLGLPLLLAARLSPAARPMAALAWTALGLVLLGHGLHDGRWHEVATRLGGDVTGAGQEIVLAEEARSSLRSASEAFLVFDLSVPRGDTSVLALEVNGVAVQGSELTPTMPRLPEDTTLGGRDWRGYPQWWALKLTPDLLGAGPALRIRLTAAAGAGVVLRGDRFRDQERLYEGPSFGDWPHLVPVKLQYDGDYRIPFRAPLGSDVTRSSLGDARRGWATTRAVHRIRIVTLANDEGGIAWESAPLPGAKSVALAFAAASGTRSRTGDLGFEGGTITGFPLGLTHDFLVEQGPFRLCFRSEGRRGGHPYGSYFLVGPLGPSGRPLALSVRFRTGMKDEPAYFVLDRRRELAELRPLLDGCPAPPATALVSGAARVIDATRNNYPEDTGRWRVERVF